MKVVLHQYPTIYGLPSLSPFCHKVETYLRMRGLDFSEVTENNPRRGPRHKMPFVEIDQKIVSDSHLIINYLEKCAEEPLDHFLSPLQKAMVFAIRRTLDEDFIRIVRYSRWVDRRGWMVLKKDFGCFFPLALRSLILQLLRKSQLQQAKGSQILNFSQEEVYALGEEHLSYYESLVGSQKFLFGDRPSTADATLYAFLECVRKTPLDLPLRNSLLAKPKLIRYCDEINKSFFSSTL